MIVESLWPLAFLAAVPVIIILYLLKPKGHDHRIPSDLLWQKLLKNEQSRTFFEKFVHNILMYLQILIVVLLVIALMSPFIRVDGRGSSRKILLFDTSASMQHVGRSGKSRLEESVDAACDRVRTSPDTQFSIVTADAAGARIQAVDIAGEEQLIPMLRGLGCSDSGGGLALAQDILDTLTGSTAEDAADLIVYTDGAGAAGAGELRSTGEKQVFVAGEAVSNLANEYTAVSRQDDGTYDVMVSLVNYSDAEAACDVGLYDEAGALIALSQMRIMPSEREICLFEQIDWRGQTLSSRIDLISFADGAKDSLAKDDVSYAVKDQSAQINGLLVGAGNTFIERAYLAVTGNSITKAQTDAPAANGSASPFIRTPLKEMGYNVIVYDAGEAPRDTKAARLVFGDGGIETAGTVENVVLDMTDCDLTAGLSGFSVGVNKAYCFTLPEGAKSFLEYDGKCVGYYGERDGVKEIVAGFDIRESDFPLRAEFPVFLANAMTYLADTSWLAANVCYAGEEIVLQPWAELDRSTFDSRPDQAGLYEIGNEEHQEFYVVRFQSAAESDGREEAASTDAVDNTRLRQVKQTLRGLFLVLALILLIAEWIVYVRRMRYKGAFYLIVRCAVLLCVLLAAFGVQLRLSSSRCATVFVVDLSNSNEEHLDGAQEYLADMIGQMPDGNVYGIVTFGKDALTEQFLTSDRQYSGLMTLPERSATDLEDAISKALTLIPADHSKRLVVLTDGRQTRGDVQNMAQALTSGQVELLTLLYEDEERPDAYIENVLLPAYLHPGDKYPVTVLVESNYDADAVLTLYNGSRQAASNKLHLNKGSNRFVLSAQVDPQAGSGAMEDLRVQIRAEGDTCPENDVFSAYSVVESAPRVLVITGKETRATGFAPVLSAAGCDYSVVSALNAPDSIDEMLDYRAIILVDAYIDDLPSGFLACLETYVKDHGCGFICCGGEDSFALGGYQDTVLETVLPVDMQLRGANEMPSMAMVMVIDHSGSMSGEMNAAGASNLDIAIRAATVAVDNLRTSDQVGVLTFDDQYSWQVELAQADDKAAIKEEIRHIKDGGGTTIKPALQEACRAIGLSDASIKHVVLLTDGMGETADYSDVIDSYTGSGITLSTVAVGDGADKRLLKTLADGCGGRYYRSDLSSDIPRIFAQEVFLGGDSFIQNGVFALSAQSGHELTRGLFPDGWPVLYGYVSATPKTASNPVIRSDKDDPILTVWQYGLGRTAAWNSDVTGEWSGAFAGKDDYAQLWKRIVDYAAGNARIGEDDVSVVTAGDVTEVTYQAKDPDSDTQVSVVIIDPQGDSYEEKLQATAPGSYSARIPTPQTGLYHLNIRRTQGGGVQGYMTTAAVVQFSDEYKFDVSAEPYRQFAERYGRLITEDDMIWTRLSTGNKGMYPLAGLLTGLAICLFLADVAFRRFQYVPWSRISRGRKRKKAAVSVQQGQPGRVATDPASGATAGGAGAAGASGEMPNDGAGGRPGKRPEKKRRPSRQPQQTLDTSQLLKKKDDRKN